MAEQNPRYSLESNRLYTVFRLIVEDRTNTNSGISKELDLSQGMVGDCLNSLEHFDIVQKGQKGRSQPYEIKIEGLVSLFCEIWNIDEEKVDPGFQDFLHRYVELYDKGDSSIRKMLREDFAEAAVSYHREHESWPEGLEILDEVPGLEGFVPVQDYFERAVEDVFEGGKSGEI